MLAETFMRQSSLVVRKDLPLYSDRLWRNLTAGRLIQAAPTHTTASRFFATGHLRPAFIFSSPVCDSVGAAQIFRVCQLQDSSLNGQWLRAARYALRGSRSVVVSLSLSRRSRI